MTAIADNAPLHRTDLPHDAVERAANGTPAAYRTGSSTFMGVELLTDPGALVPRTETELLGRAALRTIGAIEPFGRGVHVVDMCCGSGNLACALATALPALCVEAADLTDGCVSLARRNVARLGLGGRVGVHQGDLFGALSGCGLEGRIDVVVANPPYISSARLERDRAVLTAHEPREAFDGGPYGLTLHQRLIADAPLLLRPGAWLLCEFGLGQARQISRLFQRAGGYDAVELVADHDGAPRVAVARTRVRP